MAAPAKNAVSTGKPKVAGSVYIGSSAAAAPADATTELGTGWTPLGYVGEDGVTNENSPETDSKKAWGGDIVLKLQSEKPDTFTFKLISSLDLDVLKAVYGDGNVTGTLADGITVTATGEELPEKQWVIDMVMRDNAVKRIYIPSGSISEIGEIVYKDDEEVGYELTIMAMPGSDGATHKEFIKRAAGTGGG